MASLTSLPRDPLTIILKQLSTLELIVLSRVCVRLRAACAPHWPKRGKRLILQMQEHFVRVEKKGKGRLGRYRKALNSVLLEQHAGDWYAFLCHYEASMLLYRSVWQPQERAMIAACAGALSCGCASSFSLDVPAPFLLKITCSPSGDILAMTVRDASSTQSYYGVPEAPSFRVRLRCATCSQARLLRHPDVTPMWLTVFERRLMYWKSPALFSWQDVVQGLPSLG